MADPAARLSAFVDNHIRFHVARRHSTHVSNMELRSLSRGNLTRILRLRDGIREGAARDPSRRRRGRALCHRRFGMTAMAIIQMITGVIVWFRPDERLSVEEVTETYLSMTMRLVGADKNPREKRDVHAHAEFRAG